MFTTPRGNNIDEVLKHRRLPHGATFYKASGVPNKRICKLMVLIAITVDLRPRPLQVRKVLRNGINLLSF